MPPSPSIFLTVAASGILGELEVLAVFNQEKSDKQLIGGRITDGTFKPKLPFDVVRPVNGEKPKNSVGSGRVTTLREGKSEIMIAEKGKEIGLVVTASTPINVGDIIVIKK